MDSDPPRLPAPYLMLIILLLSTHHLGSAAPERTSSPGTPIRCSSTSVDSSGHFSDSRVSTRRTRTGHGHRHDPRAAHIPRNVPKPWGSPDIPGCEPNVPDLNTTTTSGKGKPPQPQSTSDGVSPVSPPTLPKDQTTPTSKSSKPKNSKSHRAPPPAATTLPSGLPASPPPPPMSHEPAAGEASSPPPPAEHDQTSSPPPPPPADDGTSSPPPPPADDETSSPPPPPSPSKHKSHSPPPPAEDETSSPPPPADDDTSSRPPPPSSHKSRSPPPPAHDESPSPPPPSDDESPSPPPPADERRIAPPRFVADPFPPPASPGVMVQVVVQGAVFCRNRAGIDSGLQDVSVEMACPMRALQTLTDASGHYSFEFTVGRLWAGFPARCLVLPLRLTLPPLCNRQVSPLIAFFPHSYPTRNISYFEFHVPYMFFQPRL